MNKKEMIQLIDNLAIAALNWDLAKKNMERCEENYNLLLEKFNNEMDIIDHDAVIQDEEFINKTLFIDKIFKSFGVNK